jgi:PAS domain S-box-containing protein
MANAARQSPNAARARAAQPGARSAAKTAAQVVSRDSRPTAEEAESLTHELRVHQVELESQNEELRQTQLDLAAARDRFIDLYDFAPVAYFTLDRSGCFVEANLTTAALLGVQRRSLLGRPVQPFIVATDAGRWREHLHDALLQDGNQRIDLSVQPSDALPIHAQLDCRRVLSAGAEPMLRVALTNVTQRKLAELDRRIAADVVKSREAERRRVARELHDDLGQRLSALKMDLASLPSTRGVVAERVAAMLDVLDDAVATVRRISSELRPVMLDDLGLNAAMEWLARDAGRRLGLTVTLQLDELEAGLDESTTIAIYRIVQEVLAHVARFAGARDVSVTMGRVGDELRLSLKHDGSGWPLQPPASDDSEATRPLREHARMLGGRLTVQRLPGGGQRITLSLPIARADTSPARPAPRSPE